MLYNPVLPPEAFVDKHDQRLGGHTQRTLVSLNDPKNYVAIVDLSISGIPILYFSIRENAEKQFNMIMELTDKAYQYVVQNAIDIIKWAINKIETPAASYPGHS